MEQVISGSKSNKIWVDGNTLVRAVGEAEASEYLYGKGYQSQLSKFIARREQQLEEEMRAKEQRRNARLAKKPIAPEPGEEE